MAGGNWSVTEQTVLPGLYMNFEAAALAAIQPGARGVMVLPVRANWGPVRQFVTITRETELIDAYTDEISANVTAYKCGRLALLGGPKQLLTYRLADDAAAVATKTLVDDAEAPGANVIRLDSIYPTTRAFSVTTQENLVDATKQDVKLYEGTTLLRTFTATKGSTDAMVAAINEDAGNKWIVATKLAAGTGTLKAAANQAFAGGNSGAAGVVNADYIEMQDAMEAQKFNLFALDGATDEALQTSFVSWTKRVRSEGKGVVAVLGGTSAVDKAADAIAQGNTRSATMNHEGVINLITGVKLDGVEYSSAEVAAFIAGAIGGQKLSESITYFATPFDDVTRRSTRSEQTAAILGGSLMLIHDGKIVKVLRAINTLITLRQNQNNQFKKIRAIRVMDAINDDLQTTAEANYIGKINNTNEGRLALIGAFKAYMRLLGVGGVIETEEGKDWDVYLDPRWYGDGAVLVPEPDEVYTYWEARLTDVMEKIFCTFKVK